MVFGDRLHLDIFGTTVVFAKPFHSQYALQSVIVIVSKSASKIPTCQKYARPGERRAHAGPSLAAAQRATPIEQRQV